MKLLCIDTATDQQSIALVDGDQVLASSSILRRGGHGPGILDDLHNLLETVDESAGAVDGYVIGLGPGSFTGLRIGLATLKGLALAFKKPIYGVRTSAILRAAAQDENAIAMMDARRGEVYLEGGPLQRPLCCPPERVWQSVGTEEEWCFVGDGAVKYAEVLDAPGHAYRPPKELTMHHPQAAYLAVLANLEKPDSIAHLEPVYVRKSDAEINYPDGFPNAAQRTPKG